MLIGLVPVGDYRKHGRTFPNQRVNAGPDQSYLDFRSSPGRCAPSRHPAEDHPQVLIIAPWVSDYGDPDTKEGFEAAYTYSPLHNVDPGIAYPATLVSTADHDDRVVPLHSFKFAAALQHSQASEAPVLLRVDSSAGHGAGKSTAMVAAEWADLLAFAAHHTHLIVPPEG